MMLTRVGLWFAAIAPILVGFTYIKCSELDLFNLFLILIISMGFFGGFSCLLHFMLPTKRLAEGAVVEDDSGTDRERSLKKHRIGCLTTATGKTAAANDGNKSESSNNNSGVVIGSSNSGGGCSGVVEMAFGNGNQTDIDEDLHSRQLAVYGRETMRRLFASNILVSGMQGLGAEIGTKILITGGLRTQRHAHRFEECAYVALFGEVVRNMLLCS